MGESGKNIKSDVVDSTKTFSVTRENKNPTFFTGNTKINSSIKLSVNEKYYLLSTYSVFNATTKQLFNAIFTKILYICNIIPIFKQMRKPRQKDIKLTQFTQ